MIVVAVLILLGILPTGFFVVIFLPLIYTGGTKKVEEMDKLSSLSSRFCPACGFPLRGYENFCPRCGYRLK